MMTYTVNLEARASHVAGPEPEWKDVAAACAAYLADSDLRFSVDTGPSSFAGCVVVVDQCEVDTAGEEADDGSA